VARGAAEMAETTSGALRFVNVKVERARLDTDQPLARESPAGAPELSVEHAGPFTLSGRLQSFRYAARGVRLMLRSQHNAWLHAVASCCVLIVGGVCLLSIQEWCWIVLAIMAVWTAEALNTALEFLADVASPEFHPLVGRAKDVAAGGVLVAACGSVIIALLVMGPHLLHMLAHLL
jgi:diacylglycerol kinase (ATP)